jgi:hypothetical protein
VAAILCQEIYYNQSATSTDPTYATSQAVICMQTVICTNIMATCSPLIKPFLESLSSSGMKIDAITGTQHAKYSSAGSERKYDVSTSGTQLAFLQRSAEHSTVISTKLSRHDWDAESQSSQSQFIRETKTWTVTVESQNATTELPTE